MATTTNPTAPILTESQKNWLDALNTATARRSTLNDQLRIYKDPNTQINQTLTKQLVETETALRKHFAVGYATPTLLDLALQNNSKLPAINDYNVGDRIFSNDGSPSRPNPATPTGGYQVWQGELATSLIAAQNELNRLYDSLSGDAWYFFKEGIVRPGASSLIDSLGGRYFITSPSQLFPLPRSGSNTLDWGPAALYDDRFKSATGIPSLGDRIMTDILGPAPGSQPKPSRQFLNSLDPLTPDSLAYAIIDEAGAWAITASLGDAALQEALQYNQTLQADVARALSGKDIENATISNEDGIIVVQFTEGDYFLFNRDGQGAVISGAKATNGVVTISSNLLDGNWLSTTISDGHYAQTRFDSASNFIDLLELDDIQGTLSYSKPALDASTIQSNLYSLTSGDQVGQTLSLSGDSIFSQTTLDLYASLFDQARDLSLSDSQAILNASEIFTLTGTQATGSAWGGTDWLEFSGGALGEYWDITRDADYTGNYYTFDGSVDYSLPWQGASLGSNNSLLSYSGLGFQSAFSLAGDSGGMINFGYGAAGNSTTTSLTLDRWGYSPSWNTVSTTPLSTTATTVNFDYLLHTDDWRLTTGENDGLGNYSYEWTLGSGSSSNMFYYTSSSSAGGYWWLPVALDLDGDGIELVNKEDSRAYFDVKGDGFRNKVGWIGADDGFLAIDKNNDGKIDQADELSFALWTANPDDTDLEALKTVFDTNLDGKLDAADAQWNQLRVWQDANGDGITDAGELKTLAQAGMASLNLTAAKTDWASGGNRITGFTTWQKTDGTNGWAADVGLGYEADGWNVSVQGSLVRATQSGGLVYGLSAGGALNLDLGSQGLNGAIGGAGADVLNAGTQLGALLNGGDGNDTLTGGTGDDWLSGGAGSDTLKGGAGDDTLLIDVQDLQANINGGDGFDIAVVTGSQGVTLDIFHTKLEAAIGGDGDDRFFTTGTARAVLAGQGGNDILKSGAGHDILQGGTGNDTLYGGYGTDIAVYTGYQKDYELAANANGSLTVRDINLANGDDGVDTLYGIQTIRFVDGDINLAPSNTGQGEFRVNTTTTRDQFYPSVAALTDGGFVVTWMDDTPSPTNANIYAQRYGTGGNAVGAEFLVNTYTTNQQEIPSVTGLANGGYVIVWRSNGQDGSGRGIYGQRYGADNTKTGAEFRINTYTTNEQDDPTVISLADGGFLVTWQSNGQDGSGYGIYAQRYASNGSAAGVEFRVNTTTSNHQNNPELTMLTDGGFVVTWSSGATPSTSNIYAQRFDAAGNKVSGEIKVNTTVYGAESSVTALADGGYVVAWLAIVSGSQWHVFGQRYAANGTAIGGELMLSTSSTGSSSSGYNSLQVAPVVTALLDGSYVATWTVYSASGADIYMRRAMDGNAIGDVVRVNTTTVNNQSTPAVTAMPDGGFVVTWTSVGQDGSGSEAIYAQRYDADGRPWTSAQTITGSQNADHLSAAASQNAVILVGQAGNDLLQGGHAIDTLVGGLGDDTYVLDNTSDVITENAGEGTDTVQSSVSWTLGANLENLTLTGSANINATGNSANNALTGNSGNNVLAGLAGNDTYVVNNTGNGVTEHAGEGTDTVQSSVSWVLGANLENLTLTGSANIDATGNSANNLLTGNIGNNTLNGGGGIDTMLGGGGNDIYLIDDATDVVTEHAGEGTDTVQSSVSWALGANLENLTLTSNAAVTGTGNSLNNTLMGNSANNTLTGGAGDDILKGSETPAPTSTTINSLVVYAKGTPVGGVYPIMKIYVNGALFREFTVNTTSYTAYSLDPSKLGMAAGKIDVVFSNDATNAAAGEDRNLYVQKIVVNGQTLNAADNGVFYDVGSGASAFDGIDLRQGAETIYSNGALRFTLIDNDTLDGGTGADQMAGGIGNDTYVVDSASDTVTEALNEGIDTVRSGVTRTLDANVENLVLTGTTSINGTGNALNNLLIGNNANNTLAGGDGADVLLGYNGNDRLDGGAGNDVLQGGQGSDTYVVDSTGDSIWENTNEGWADTVETALSYTLGGNLENLTLTSTAAVNGTGNTLDNTLIGNSAANTLKGGAGYDTLDGGAGADRMEGGTEDDGYYVDNVDDVVVENAGEGDWDWIETTLDNYVLSTANVEALGLAWGAGNLNATGNAANNWLGGNEGNNVLTALGGNDELDGGEGQDTLIGGAGDDMYYLYSGEVLIDSVVENLNEGTDTVNFYGSEMGASYTLAANVENATTMWGYGLNLTGNTLNNILTGDYGDNVLDGGAGDDTLAGGYGNDTYVVDSISDVITENAGEGMDTVKSSVSWTLDAYQENLTLTGYDDDTEGTGNELANVIEGSDADNTLWGLDGNDTLKGGVGRDSLDGGAGNDSLYGGAGYDDLDGGIGADHMEGGTGDDGYLVDNVGDVVVENAGEGDWDFVMTTLNNYALVGNVESLFLSWYAGNLNGTGNVANNGLHGNEGNNVLTGLDGNDWLDGRDGADTLIGGWGDDTYVVDNAGDVVTENAGEGTDKVIVSGSFAYTLGATIENGGRWSAGTLNGNALNNVLTGSNANDSLVGGSGNDTVNGGYGNDWMVGGAGADQLNGGGGTSDWGAYSGSSQAVSINLALNTATGGEAEGDTYSGVECLFGSRYNDILIGDAANNQLQGSAGNDLLDGGAGSDTATYYSDTGGVRVDLAVGAGMDAYGGTDTLLNIENAGGSNVGNDVLSGSAANNSLSGGGGNDALYGRGGNDWIDGGTGNDTYYFNRGDGADSWTDNDATLGNTDVARFAGDIAHDQIWFRKVGNDLEASVIGTSDKAMVKNWYTGSNYHLERFEAGNGKVLLDSQLQALVDAMAAFTPPAAGQTTLPTTYQDALAPVLAANWQ